MKKTVKKVVWSLSLIFVFSTLLIQGVSAEKKKDVEFKGKWDEGARSVSSTIPVSAFINEGVLSLHSSTQCSDITICVLKEGEIVYEKNCSCINDRLCHN